MTTNENLPSGFSILQTSRDEFNKIVGNLKESIFSDDELCLWPRDVISDQEKIKLKELNKDYKENLEIHFVLFHEDRLAGWCSGYQDTKEGFCMANSAILPEFRRRGLYTLLLKRMLDTLTELGFQRIWSLHKMTNNKVIIPKLKNGFVITGTRINDMSGAMVELAYFTNPIRRNVMDFRTGARPDDKLKSIFKL